MRVRQRSYPVSREPEIPIRVVSQEPDDHVFARWSNLTLIHWRTEPRGSHVRGLEDMARQVLQDHPEGFSTVQLVREGIGLPDAEARAGIAKMMSDLDMNIACIAVVFMGAGFWVSALQSVVTGIRLLAPRTFQMRFASEPIDLATWLPAHHHRRTGVQIDPAALAQAIDRVLSL